MSTNPSTECRPLHNAVWVVLLLAFLACVLGPHMIRLQHPSLCADDVTRVMQLQTLWDGRLMLTPFNEHLSPLFQGISWLTWKAAGRSLVRAPRVFTIASYLPFLLALGLIARVIRRETRSNTAALLAVALFSLSGVAIEAVNWYSACSFQWALVATLAAWSAAATAVEANTRDRRLRASLVAMVTAAASPAFSAIGLLAGPVAAVRAAAAVGPEAWGALRQRLAVSVAPLAGMLAYVTVYFAFMPVAAIARKAESSMRFGSALMSAVRAPVAALLPTVAALRPSSATGAWAVAEAALTVILAVALVAASRHSAARPLVVGGLTLITGGYVLTYCPRSDPAIPGPGLFLIMRYHLFPGLGLILIVAPALSRGLGRFDARPVARLIVATAVASVLLLLHLGEFRLWARMMYLPNQARTLAAIERLGAVCTAEGITRDQALAALEPVSREWTAFKCNALMLLKSGVATPRLPNHLVRPTLLAALTPSERLAVFGGMDASPYLCPAADADCGREPVAAVGRLVKLLRVHPTGDGRYVVEGCPSFLEYEFVDMGTGDNRAHALGLEGSLPGDQVELWWRGEGGSWDETRSVRLRPRPDTARPGRGWLLALDSIPHWDPSQCARIRLMFHAPGPLALAAPRLVR